MLFVKGFFCGVNVNVKVVKFDIYSKSGGVNFSVYFCGIFFGYLLRVTRKMFAFFLGKLVQKFFKKKKKNSTF